MPYEAITDSNEDAAIVRMKECLSKFETEQGRLAGFAFKPRPSDVFIVTSPKAGTTWLQHICHQLRTKGDMEFGDVSEVVPWIELAHDLGQDLQADQPGEPPRLYKTHAWRPDVPKGGRYIVCFRDPADVVFSFYRFFDGWFIQPQGALSFETFAQEFFLRRGKPEGPMQNASYWHHLVSWLGGEGEEEVLFVAFEDMKEDLDGQVRRIATFLGYVPGLADYEERVNVATAHSTLAFMQEYRDKFDEHLTQDARNEVMGLPREAGRQNSKVKQGLVGAAGAVMTPDLLEAMRAKWEEVVTPSLGCVDYKDLLARHRRQQAT